MEIISEDSYLAYSPYCPNCSSCGQSGCCSPINCTMGDGCHYKESNLEELKEGYRENIILYNWLADNDYFGKEEEINKLLDN